MGGVGGERRAQGAEKEASLAGRERGEGGFALSGEEVDPLARGGAEVARDAVAAATAADEEEGGR